MNLKGFYTFAIMNTLFISSSVFELNFKKYFYACIYNVNIKRYFIELDIKAYSGNILVKTFYWTHIKWTFIYIQYLQLIFSEKCIRAIQSCISLLGSDQECILFLPWKIYCQVCFYRKLRFFRHNEFILVIIFKFKKWNEWNAVLLTIHKFSLIDNLQDLFWLKRNLILNNSYMHVWNSLPTSFFKNTKTKQKIKIQ